MRRRGALGVDEKGSTHAPPDGPPDGSGRVAVGGVAPKPWRVEAAEAEMARGARAVADGLFADARPTHHNEFKRTLTQRTLNAVLTEARG